MSFWSFIIPNVGTGFWKMLCVMLSLVCAIGAVMLSANLLFRFRSRAKKLNREKPSITEWGISIGIALSFILLAYFGGQPETGASASVGYSIFAVCRGIVAFFDPVLDISNLRDNPLNEFLGINLFIRILLLYALIAVILVMNKCIAHFAWRFYTFLNQTILSKQPDESNMTEKSNKKKVKKEDKGQKEVWESTFSKVLKWVLTGTGSSILAYIFGTDDMKDGIVHFLHTAYSVICQVTVLDQLDTQAVSFSSYFNNVLVVLLSLFTLAIYFTAIILFGTFCISVAKNWPDITEKMKNKQERKKIFGILAAVGIATLTITFVVGVSGLLQTEFLRDVVASGARNVLYTTANIAALFLAFCMIFILLVFLVAFSVVMVVYAYRTVKGVIQGRGQNSKTPRFFKMIGVASAFAVVVVVVLLYYDKWIYGLRTIMEITMGHDIGLMDMLMFTGGALAFLVGVILLLTIALLLVVTIALSAVKFARERTEAQKEGGSLLEKTIGMGKDLFLLIPLAIKHICMVFKVSIPTIFQIFVGYRNESEKNQAIFLAACFASLASLINTFFGLKNFYHEANQSVFTICALAISFAVQLAMLIFGMKAGERLAEQEVCGGGGEQKRLRSAFALRVLLLLVSVFLEGALIGAMAMAIGKQNWLFAWGLAVAVLGTILFIIGCFRQLKRLWLRCKELNNQRSNPQTATKITAGGNVHGDGRIVPWYRYLICYLLLMLVSTGFAYTNMFGYYAADAHLYQQVYDQVHYEAEEGLGLISLASTLVEDYQANEREFLNEFNERAGQALKDREINKRCYEEKTQNTNNQEGINRRNRYNAATKDLESVISAVRSIASMDYGEIGKGGVILIEEYSHYVGSYPYPDYQTTYLTVDLWGGNRENQTLDELQGAPEEDQGNSQEEHFVAVGTKASDNTIDIVTVSGVPYSLPKGRYVDLDGVIQSITKSKRKVSGADKYTIMKELLAAYARIEDYIYVVAEDQSEGQGQGGQETDNNAVQQEDGGTTTQFVRQNVKGVEGVTAALYPRLDSNAALRIQYDTVLDLYQKEFGEEEPEVEEEIETSGTSATMKELPSIVRQYLDGKKSIQEDILEDAGKEDSAQGTGTAKKEVGYQELSEYIDRALTLYGVLGQVEGQAQQGPSEKAESPVDDPAPSVGSTEDPTPSESATEAPAPSESSTETPILSESLAENPTKDLKLPYKIRQYQNYAQGITYSGFQISVDILSRGLLNPCKDKINVLYTAFPVAVFILIICALVDFLAFFSGLILFKNIYLFDTNKKIEKIGYLNYEAVLIDLLTPPSDPSEKLLHLAFLYQAIHGDPTKSQQGKKQSKGVAPSYIQGMEKLRNILASYDFQCFCQEKYEALKALGIEEGTDDYTNFQLWAGTFVQRQGIDFSALFQS